MKRYVEEPGSDEVLEAMRAARSWWTCRIAFAEALKAIVGAGSVHGEGRLRDDWPRIAVVEVDQSLVESAGVLAIEEGLRTLDALHLAAAVLVPGGDRVLATWDSRLWLAARRLGIQLLPDHEPRFS